MLIFNKNLSSPLLETIEHSKVRMRLLSSEVITTPHPTSPRYNFYKMDILAIKDNLELLDWTPMLQFTDVDLMVEFFYNKLNEIIERYVPLTKTHIPGPFPHWFSPRLIQLIKL